MQETLFLKFVCELVIFKLDMIISESYRRIEEIEKSSEKLVKKKYYFDKHNREKKINI